MSPDREASFVGERFDALAKIEAVQEELGPGVNLNKLFEHVEQQIQQAIEGDPVSGANVDLLRQDD